MKIKIISLILFIFSIFLFYGYRYREAQLAQAIYLNSADETSFLRLKKLEKALKNAGKTTFISRKNHFMSGKFNIYAAENELNLPTVIDKNAINFLWIPTVPQDNIEIFRDFDVIVVQNIPSFAYLKAINARTAYIPEAIDIKHKPNDENRKGLMYYGDNNLGFALALYLLGPSNLHIDLFGKGYEDVWRNDEIMKRPAREDDFPRYALVLADQAEEQIRDELINRRVIDIIENGGLPYLRYNSGLAKIFGDDIPMYMNQSEFLPKLQELLAHPESIKTYLNKIYQTAQQWNSSSQAKKFIELFEVMEKKMIIKD